MKTKLLGMLVIVLSLVTVLAGCGGGGSNPPPANPTYTFQPVATQLYVTAGQQVNFILTPSADDSGITYAWNATGGSPASGNTASYSWTAPGVIGSYTVKVTVSRDSTQIATYSWNVEVCDSINLTVFALNTELKLEKGATIEITGTGVGTYRVTTDPDTGYGTISNVPKNSFYIKVVKTSFVTGYYWVDLNKLSGGNWGGVIFTWSQMETIYSPIVFDHNKSVFIGKVTDSGGNGVSGAVVSILPASGTMYYGDDTGSAIDFAAGSTNASGGFMMVNVDNGNYTVTASQSGKSYTSSRISVTEPAIYVVQPIIEN